ncbi:uncharacterized protein [Anabrus simplex]|uniref:uncharacterized protein isoform X2 n=1 Tax=Anabrus simplex TaxID=316456 RepID=UPI0035A3562F
MYKQVCVLLAFVVIAVMAQDRDPRCLKDPPPSEGPIDNFVNIYFYDHEESACFLNFVEPEGLKNPDYANHFDTERECENACNPDHKTVSDSDIEWIRSTYQNLSKRYED